jgi:hypothetical protein
MCKTFSAGNVSQVRLSLIKIKSKKHAKDNTFLQHADYTVLFERLVPLSLSMN